MRSKTPNVYVRPEYTVEDISIMWAVPQDAVKEWIRDGELERSTFQQQVTAPQLARFVNSPIGLQLIAAAREA